MDRGSRAAPTDSAESWARAGGHRRHNSVRKLRGPLLVIDVLHLARRNEDQWGVGHGLQDPLAGQVGVSPVPNARDVKPILDRFREPDA